MVRQVKMPMERSEFDALMEVAETDLRSVGNQARHWVRSALQDRGLLDVWKNENGEDEQDD